MSRSIKKFGSLRGLAGFSLIEVLIAVVVLSVGLLALGALQVSLVRSAADTKSRGAALALAEDRLEEMRAFADSYDALAGGTETTAQLGGAIGGVDYTRTTIVQRYAFDRVNQRFVAVASTADGSLPAMGSAGASPQWAPGVEFKRISIEVRWTDALAATQTVRVTDSLSAISPGSGLPASSVTIGKSRNPVVLYRDPSLEGGVIPIAIGDGSDTAATNPRPEVAGRQNSSRVIETRFDVLTYRATCSNPNDPTNPCVQSTAQVQARVETVVVGCTCQSGTSSEIGYEPSVWNGLRYTRPALRASGAPGSHAALSNNDPPESELCTECCRDHHDNTGSGPKFSPRRTSHTHAINNGRYPEACRLIRVDGIFHTAADMSNDYFNLLATADGGNSPLPSATASGNYENFVLAYLNDRALVGTQYNNPPAQSTVLGLETTHSINDPSTIQLRAIADTKWLHGRGLYIDFLEADAVNMVNNAKSRCDLQASTLQACVLKHVPFTSINLTELSNWTPDSGTQIVVTNNDFRDSVTSIDPVRGRVNSISATVGSNQVATGSIWNSNAGVALLLTPINGEVARTDSQEFSIIGSGGGGTGTPGSFALTISGYPFSDSSSRIPAIAMTPAGTCNHATTGGSRPNPYTCSSASLGGAVALNIGNYNFSRTARVTQTLTCTNANNPTETRSFSVTYNQVQCVNYVLSSATVGGVAGTIGSPLPSDGVVAESTRVEFGTVAPAAAVAIGFTLQGTTAITGTCTYNPNNNKVTPNPGSCP